MLLQETKYVLVKVDPFFRIFRATWYWNNRWGWVPLESTATYFNYPEAVAKQMDVGGSIHLASTN